MKRYSTKIILGQCLKFDNTIFKIVDYMTKVDNNLQVKYLKKNLVINLGENIY